MIDKETMADATATVAFMAVGMAVATAAGVIGGLVAFFTLVFGYVAIFKRG